MTGTRLPAEATSLAVPLSRCVHPVMGWRHSRTVYRDQLTHAVIPGRTVAECGVIVMALGEPWPEPGAGTPLGRCSICAQAVDGLWTRVDSDRTRTERPRRTDPRPAG
jgi:hypothetical protein